jgi:formate hydrogenlyase subunit 4
MPLIQLVITLVVVGVILWLINSYIPMQATIKKILNAVVVIVVILWLLNVFGVLGPISGMHIGGMHGGR